MSGTGEKRLHFGQAVNHSGSGTWNGDMLNMASATFNNLANGAIDLQSGSFNGGTFNNAGTLTKTTAADFFFFTTGFNNTGTVHVNAGTFYVYPGTSQPGVWDGAGHVYFGEAMTFTPTSRLVTRDVTFNAATTVNGTFGPLNTTVNGGSNTVVTFAGPQQYPVGATMTVHTPRVDFYTDAGGAGTGAGNLDLSLQGGSTAIFQVSQRLGTLAVHTGSFAQIAPTGPAGSKVVVTRSYVEFSGEGRFDLTKHGAVIDHPGNLGNYYSFFLREHIKGGYNGGAWNGTGIASSTAAGGTQTGIGYAEASDVLALSGTQTATFCGITVDATSTLARYTLYGDATLDGQVGFVDLVRLAQNYNVTDGSQFWAQGDFDYDGNVNFADLVKLAQNYNNTLLPAAPLAGGSADFEADWARAVASVPEPGLALAGAFVTFALAPRRKRARLPASRPRAPS
jgi:hypothetical protein